MREILFRGKDIDGSSWYTGSYMTLSDTTYCIDTDYAMHPDNTKHYIVFDRMTDWGLPNRHMQAQVDPNSIGQFTGMHEFVMTDKSAQRPLFEGDIVELWSRRRLPTESYYTEKSQHDGECKIRAVIVFKNGEWRLDYNNEYNNKIAVARGNELYDRAVNRNYSLFDVYPGFHGDMDKYREMNKRHKSHDIVCIGNIFDNPELLKE